MSDLTKYIKEELTYQERLLEGSIKVESFFKKYKKILIVILIAVVVGIITTTIVQYINEQKIYSSNELYIKLLQNHDEKLLEELKKQNHKLYLLYTYQNAVKNSNLKELNSISSQNIEILSDLSNYQLTSLDFKNKNLLSSYIMNNNAILKELALVTEAYTMLQNRDYNSAKLKLSLISPQSSLKSVADELQHLLVSKK